MVNPDEESMKTGGPRNLSIAGSDCVTNNPHAIVTVTSTVTYSNLSLPPSSATTINQTSITNVTAATANANIADDTVINIGDGVSTFANTQVWQAQYQNSRVINGTSMPLSFPNTSNETNSFYANISHGLPNSTIVSSSQNINYSTLYGQQGNNFLSSTQIHNGTHQPNFVIENSNLQIPFSIAVDNSNNNFACQNERRYERTNCAPDTQQNHSYSSAPSRPPAIAVSGSNTHIPSLARSAASNMFEGTQIFSQPIPTATYAQPGMTFNNAHTLPNNNNRYLQFNNTSSADTSMSSSQIAARQVISKDLPNFSGRPDEWPVFITNYNQSTERCGFTDQENLIRLQKCLKGPALEAVRGKLMMPSTVSQAIETLRMLFGRLEVIHHALQAKLRDEPKVRVENLNTLISLALSVQNYCATIQAIGLGDYLNDPMLLNDLVSKLPSNMKLEWGRHCMSGVRVNLLVFDEWLFNLATCASQVTTFDVKFDSSEYRNSRKGAKESLMFHDVEKTKEDTPQNKSVTNKKENICTVCLKCGGEHKLSTCSDFISLKHNDRWQFVRQNKLCFRCFGKHSLRRCYSKKPCGTDGCKLPHNLLLHTKPQQLNTNGGQESPVLFHAGEKKVAVFRYVPITLYGNNISLDTWALIDEGAGCTLVEDEIVNQLGIDGPSEELCLRWTGDVTKTYTASKKVSIYISSREKGSMKHKLLNVRTVEKLDLPEQTLESSTINSCEYLRNLPITPYTKIKPSVIIGLDNAKLGVPSEIRASDDGELMAAKCKLGWTVYGRKYVEFASDHCIFHICECNCSSGELEKIDELMQEYFSLESLGVSVSTKPLTSVDDERALKIMDATAVYDSKEKRWAAGLLWKFDRVELPNSLPMAKRRLKCLEAKMMREPSLKEFLVEKIKDYENKGYVRKLHKNEVTSGGKSWYIPIFTVTNINKNKTRLVWDAAAKVNGVALNSCLLKGPDLLKSLVGVLLRFREKPVALCGDIREMFHQIKVINEDQKAQMFLWRGGDTTADIDVYCMQVMTFGASCSPSLANYIKSKNANRFVEKYPSAVNAILENTFVDDWLQSCQTEEEMVQLAEKVRYIHKDGGFEMRNWISNSPRVLEKLTGNKIKSNKCIQQEHNGQEKVLGMWWLPNSDEFTFIQKIDLRSLFDKTQVTKRQILRVIMKIFDPLGFLGYYIIFAKIILQNVWRSGVSWDEPIKPDELEMWLHWIKYINFVSYIRIPRCYPLVSVGKNIQLHIFVDASNSAYAAVAYIRAQLGTDVKCSLVASKTRVAPLKPISIPRMELMAAIVGLRLSKLIMAEMSINIEKRFSWSDSKDVLFWIRSDARKFKQFVALRIGEILEKSKVSEWRWVPSAENVADEGTKWSTTPKFDNNIRWFTGPDFLLEDEKFWPTITFNKSDNRNFELLCHFEENHKTVSTLAEISPDPTRFSRWEKLRHTQLYILKFLKLISKEKEMSSLLNMLTEVINIRVVESIIFRNCQEESFGEEINSLKSEGKQISRKSILFKCSPYLDSMGVLRIKGRIDAAEGVAVDTKRPIILPRKHAVTNLVVDFYHRRFHHHHNEIVVNEMRQRFWIPGLRAVVRSVSSVCQICKNKRATPNPPEMGELPPERLMPYTRPFTYTGIDFFGPLEVAVGRRREKRWGVLFTCLTVRAVHIEISPSLSTDAFMLVFKQFVSRRGTPHKIISDNGTNFRGASRLLQSEIEKLSTENLKRNHPGIEWCFIPPASPHMGGVWERMVRSVKSILMDILPQTGLREDVLRAAMADVENIINTRPLTYVPLESADAEALTPNHFLVGCSSGIREKGSEEASGNILLKNFKIAGQLADQFWKRWLREYLPCLTRRSKWFSNSPSPIEVGDIVVVVDDTSKRGSWLKGIVEDVHRGKDNQVRSAVVKTIKGLITRPTVKLAKLDVLK
ncbi:uncharacterized protein LOC142235886 [Haematobia irritans]|uniref:uncharacterized protein LOC142235886 n=1 Tax=Haematobia irritans TaxID=7368 RepID=UPI003F4F837B